MKTRAPIAKPAAAIGNSFIPISNETLVKLAPDVLLISAQGQSQQTENDERLETWTRLPLPAVKNNRVFLVTDDTALTASIDLPHNVRTLAALIHKGQPAPASPATSGAGRQP